jgi:signal peptidase II
MITPPSRRPPLSRILWPLIYAIIVADQLSKAYFVYRLGTHAHQGFIRFSLGYFSLWGNVDSMGGVHAHYFPFRPFIPLWEPWFRFSLTTNTGAAWSIFEGNSFALSFVSIFMAVLLYLVWQRSFKHNMAMTYALGAIIGGALGNFIDRFRLKEVVDFIAVKIPYIGKLFPALGDPYDFPIFNVADACAVCGTIALAAYLVVADLRHVRSRRARRPGPEAFTPFRQGPDVSPEALEDLREAAAAARPVTAFGLTRHHALRAPALAWQAGGGDCDSATLIGLTRHIGLPPEAGPSPRDGLEVEAGCARDAQPAIPAGASETGGQEEAWRDGG